METNHNCTIRQTQAAIKFIKDTFQRNLVKHLNLDRITAPVFVRSDSGINDDLNGVERKVSFTIKNMDNTQAEVVQSLAKWKRMALKKYNYIVGEGIYTDMNAIRCDDQVDHTHSIFVDQWDWERVIAREDRNIPYLQETVRQIVAALKETNDALREKYPIYTGQICGDVCFITAQELADRYPHLTPKEREHEITRQHQTVFLMQIGGPLRDGAPHDGRSPDYDDWTLNGDLLLWDEAIGEALELSSMGIRVDGPALRRQLQAAGREDRLRFDYHRMILAGELPQTIGGGIGQSRLCMLLMQKKHIGQVQVSVWPPEMIAELKEQGIDLL